MLQKYKGYVWLTGLLALIFLLTACSTPGLATGTPTPEQTLQNSATAMSQLKSAHFDLQAELDLQAQTSANENPNGLTFKVTGHGDAASPDHVSTNLFLGQNPLMSVISTGGKVYVQQQGGTWYAIDQSKVNDGVQKIFSQDLSQQLGAVLAQLQDAKLTDHGQEVVNGKTLDHITATLDTATLQSLTRQLNGLLPADQQSLQNELSQATLDLWIDQTTWYVHQAALNVSVKADLSKLPTLNYGGQKIDLPDTVIPVTLKAQLNFSKFNEPVNIQAPPQAEPLA